MDLDSLENIRERLNLTSLSMPALAGIVVILVLVAVAAGRMFLGTATANDFEVVRASGAASQGQGDADSARDGEPPAPVSIFVHVSGAVNEPGLCEIAEGSRVADAVRAAGGFADDAASDSVNLARTLVDGEQIIVANRAEREREQQAGQVETGSADAAQGQATSQLVNINTAGVAELKSLPGIGDVLAQKIIDDRTANGPYKTTDDLKRVSGVGDKTYEKLSALICV